MFWNLINLPLHRNKPKQINKNLFAFSISTSKLKREFKNLQHFTDSAHFYAGKLTKFWCKILDITRVQGYSANPYPSSRRQSHIYKYDISYKASVFPITKLTVFMNLVTANENQPRHPIRANQIHPNVLIDRPESSTHITLSLPLRVKHSHTWKCILKL